MNRAPAVLLGLLFLPSCYIRTPPPTVELEGYTDFFEQEEYVHLPAEENQIVTTSVFQKPETPPLPEEITFAEKEIDDEDQEQSNYHLSLAINLEIAINSALSCNRQLANSVSAVQKSELTLAYAPAEFQLKINPTGQVGYAGGGDLGSGASYGAGLDVNRKFLTGTKISIAPAIHRIGEHWRPEIKSSITQPILRGFEKEYNLAPIRAAQYNNRSACRTLYMSEVQLIVKTIQAVYEVIKQEEIVNLSQESFERVDGFAKAARMKEKIGLADALDVYRAEIELKQAEDLLSGAQEKYMDAQDVLRELMSLPLDQAIIVKAPIEYQKPNIDSKEAISIALKNRIEVDQAEDRLGESMRLSWVAKKDLLPDVNLVMNYVTTGQDQIFARSYSHHRESTWGIGLTTSGDIERSAEHLAYDQSLVTVDEAQRGIDIVKDTITLEIKRGLRSLDRLFKRIELQEKQIHSAEGELYLAQIKFDRGLANNFDIIQAEKSLRSAQINLLTSVIDYIVGEYQLLAALGILADKPDVR